MPSLLEANPVTVEVLAALKELVPDGARIVTNERDYGWVIGVGYGRTRRSAVLQRGIVQLVTVADVPELASYLFDTLPPQNKFPPLEDEGLRVPAPILTVTFRPGFADRIELSAPVSDEHYDPMRRMIARWAEEWRELLATT